MREAKEVILVNVEVLPVVGRSLENGAPSLGKAKDNNDVTNSDALVSVPVPYDDGRTEDRMSVSG